MENKEKLKMLRSIINAKDVKINEYKTSTIESVLFGKRQNEYILFECINEALLKTNKNQEELIKWLMTFKK